MENSNHLKQATSIVEAPFAQCICDTSANRLRQLCPRSGTVRKRQVDEAPSSVGPFKALFIAGIVDSISLSEPNETTCLRRPFEGTSWAFLEEQTCLELEP